MKPLPVVAIDPVRDDVQTAYDYFEDRLGGTGDAFLQRYFATTDRIGLNAETFPVKFDDYRRALVPRSHFAVYFVEPDRALIVAVIDARRNPMLIRRRVQSRLGPV